LPFFDSTTIFILGGLALAWLIQYYFSFRQMRRFYSRISSLRKEKKGISSIGMAGSAWKRRIYAVIIFDPANHILAVEKLSGWTIFANLKPVDGLVGVALEDLFLKEAELSVPYNKKLFAAIQDAAKHVLEMQQRKKLEQSQIEEQGQLIEETAVPDPDNA